MIVLDTNVVSELIHPKHHPDVADWVNRQLRDNVHLTAITVSELVFGVERLPAGRKRDELEAIIERLLSERFRQHVLPFDLDAAREHGRLIAARERAGRPMPGNDALIAAICLARGVPLATRNTKDFEGTGVQLVNPWQGA